MKLRLNKDENSPEESDVLPCGEIKTVYSEELAWCHDIFYNKMSKTIISVWIFLQISVVETLHIEFT